LEPAKGRHCSTLFPDQPRRGRLIVITGPSGVGKSSVVEGLIHRLPFHFSVSMTTRAPRPGEEEGVDYLFVDDARFAKAVAAGELAEWAEYSGHRYGTPKAGLEIHLARGEDVLLDIELHGARQIKSVYPEALLIFIEPPDPAVLEERLRGRGDTTEAEIAERLAVAEAQIAEGRGLFDHFVINDDLVSAVDRVAGILSASRRLDSS
jgi:guanylate kinase